MENIRSICCNSEVFTLTVFALVLTLEHYQCETISDNVKTSSCHGASDSALMLTLCALQMLVLLLLLLLLK